MSGGSGSSTIRVQIPNNIRKTIHEIREIIGELHTDDEIYAILRDCSMDPNETAQKLLCFDTFHEVKRRDRKKEGLGGRASNESRLKQGGHGRGGQGASGGYSSNFPDGGGGRNLANRRENGVHHIAERSHAPSTQPVLQKTKSNTTSQATRVSAVAPHGAANQSNGKSGHGSAGQSPIDSVPKSSSAANDTGYKGSVQPQAAVVAAAASISSTDQGKSLSSSDQLQTYLSSVHSSLDPVVASSVSRNPGVSGAISREVGNNRISAGPNHVKGNQVVHEVNDLSTSKNEKSGSMNSTSKTNEVENNRLAEPSKLSSPSCPNDSLRPSSSSGSQPPLGQMTMSKAEMARCFAEKMKKQNAEKASLGEKPTPEGVGDSAAAQYSSSRPKSPQPTPLAVENVAEAHHQNQKRPRTEGGASVLQLLDTEDEVLVDVTSKRKSNVSLWHEHFPHELLLRKNLYPVDASRYESVQMVDVMKEMSSLTNRLGALLMVAHDKNDAIVAKGDDAEKKLVASEQLVAELRQEIANLAEEKVEFEKKKADYVKERADWENEKLTLSNERDRYKGKSERLELENNRLEKAVDMAHRLTNEKVEAVKAEAVDKFIEGFDACQSQMLLLYPDLDVSQIGYFKEIKDGVLVDPLD